MPSRYGVSGEVSRGVPAPAPDSRYAPKSDEDLRREAYAASEAERQKRLQQMAFVQMISGLAQAGAQAYAASRIKDDDYTGGPMVVYPQSMNPNVQVYNAPTAVG